jgi:FkbM family methyltransferase
MLMLYLIAYRLGGHQSIRIPVPFGRDRRADGSGYFAAQVSQPSQLSIGGAFGALRHFDFHFEGIRYKADCLGLEYYLHRKQYFFSREAVRIAPEPGDHVIDGGACLGDSAVVFANAVGPKGKVYAFDPVQEHIQVVEHNARQNPALQIQPMPFGLSDVDVFEDPISLETYAPGFRCDGKSVPLASIDSLVGSGAIARVDFIKFDIEGSELNALKGATSTIHKYRPKLAISIYHKPNDLFEIPIYLNNTFPFYRMYLDHYSIHSEETVCYCVDGSVAR